MSHSDPLVFVRYLDVALIVLAAPFVLLMGGPVLGYVVAGGVWIITRFTAAGVERSARKSKSAKAQVGINFGVFMGRAWIMGIAILVVGLAGEREDGLMAALVALVAFSVYLATTLIIRPTERNKPSS
jgi:cytochrome bd-type quinol oxidase subunit 2